MIPVPSGVRVWLATGHTDMRKGVPGLALLVQEMLKRDPFDGDLFIFRGRRGDLIKIVWRDGQGSCLFTKRLERGRFIWPSVADGVVTISTAGRARARKVLLPRLRRDHRAAVAVASDRARPSRAEPARPDPGLEVSFASALEPAERDLCARGR